MRTIGTLIIVVLFISDLSLAQDTMYMYKSGSVITQQALSNIDSVIFYKAKISQVGNTVTDVDGNLYNTVTTVSQVWMVENLKTTKYNDGIPIPLLSDAGSWTAAKNVPAYCWYNNDAASYKATYGAIYNWYSVNTGKLCPIGWHIPTDNEWTILTSYLGGENAAGTELKESGTTHWISQSPGATNSSGFTALPGGMRYSGGSFQYLGSFGNWWSATENMYATTEGIYRQLSYDSTVKTLRIDKRAGCSVRCLKD